MAVPGTFGRQRNPSRYTFSKRRMKSWMRLRGDLPNDLCSELGDLLFQILFLARMAEEKNHFTLIEVFEKITKKMIHRHPHVFGSTTVRSAEEVAENWDKIKKQERGVVESSPTLLMDVPAGLPALLRAHRLIERAGRLKSSQGQGERILKHAEETFCSLRENVEGKNKEAIGDDIGTFSLSPGRACKALGVERREPLEKSQ